ncbi:MAG: hypothetical protein IPN29_12240 [Saprospiraceae bacterium]|nr:hypothetical protein [Saprospiraceae bacterium]
MLKLNSAAEEFRYEFSLDQNIDWIQLDAIDRRIDAYPVTERFKVAEVASKAFASNAPAVSLFQFKTANVIGVVPETLSKFLADTWKEFGVKQFSVHNRLCDAIIESIIETGRKQVMLVFNGLLDDQRPEHLIHQQRIIQAFKMLGFEIVPIWSVSLMEDCGKEMDRIASILGLIEQA